MPLSADETRFLKKRSRLVNAWRPVGAVLLVVVGGLAGGLFWFVPLLANPFAVADRLAGQAVAESSMVVATMLLPVVVLFCLLLAAAVVLLVFAAVANERKYLAIVERLAEGDASKRSQ